MNKTTKNNRNDKSNKLINKTNQHFSYKLNKNFRRTRLITSMFISLTCIMISMCSVVGSSYAWFTDSASNTGNRIKAGSLSIDLMKYDGEKYSSIADKRGSIFDSTTIWEPGHTELAYLLVKNTGDLALKYQIVLNITDGGLAEYLDVVYANDVQGSNPVASDKWNDLTNDKIVYNIGTLLNTTDPIVAAQNGKLSTNETDYFLLAIHMKEDAPAETMNKKIIFDVNLQATQVGEESDGFGNSNYDSTHDFVTLDNVKHVDGIDTLNYVISNKLEGKLDKDLLLEEDVEVTNNFTLDLNGYNLTFKGVNIAFDFGGYEKEAIIKNSSSTKSTIDISTYKNKSDGNIMLESGSGTLTIKDNIEVSKPE